MFEVLEGACAKSCIAYRLSCHTTHWMGARCCAALLMTRSPATMCPCMSSPQSLTCQKLLQALDSQKGKQRKTLLTDAHGLVQSAEWFWALKDYDEVRRPCEWWRSY